MRTRAVAARIRGHSVLEISRMFGVHRGTVHRWIDRYKQEQSLARRPGSGRPGALSDADAKWLLRAIMKPASKYGFETDFWTSSRILQVALKGRGIRMSRSTICKMLRDADFSYKKPELRYYQASDAARHDWLTEVVPEIQRIVGEKRAILYFEDEATVRLSGVLARTWGPRGQRTIQRMTGNRASVPVMSALSPKGSLLFRIWDRRICSDQVVEFLEQLLKHHPRRHVVVVMDRARPHTSAKTAAFIKSQRRLHVFYLPAYSPDMNPDEQVWNYRKNELLKGHQAMNEAELRELSRRELLKMGKSTNLLKGLFKRCCVADLFA